MAAYYPITQSEFEAFVSPLGFRPLSLDGTHELVYGKRVQNSCNGMPLTVRIYSGINRDGNSRGVGEDAIRVCMVGKRDDEKIVGVAKDCRVNRVAGWKKNLAKRLDNFVTIRCCSKCGAPMKIRKGKNGEFYGCSNYGHPTTPCKNTENV